MREIDATDGDIIITENFTEGLTHSGSVLMLWDAFMWGPTVVSVKDNQIITGDPWMPRRDSDYKISLKYCKVIGNINTNPNIMKVFQAVKKMKYDM